MLTNWKIEGFKAIQSMIELPLAPLTIFTGSNSSGKSTVLQSILLVAQTLQHRNQGIPIVTNGALLSLGGYDDILNDEYNSRELTIGFTLNPANIIQDMSPQIIAIPSFSDVDRKAGRSIYSPQTDMAILESVSIDATFRKSEEKDITEGNQLSERFVLEGCNLSVLTRLSDNKELAFNVTAKKRDPVPQKATDLRPETDYECKIDELQEKALKEYLTLPEEPWGDQRIILLDRSTVRCSCNHFFPKVLSILHNEGVEAILALRDGLVKVKYNTVMTFWDMDGEKANIEKLTKEMREIMIDALDEMVIDDKGEEDEVKAILRGDCHKFDFNTSRVCFLVEIATGKKLLEYVKKNNKFKIAYEDALTRAKPMDGRFGISPPWLNDVYDTVSNYFSTSISYIGPLRIEPKNYYNTRLNFSSSDIGAKGEYAGEVYLDNLDINIRYISPETINNLGILPSEKKDTLKNALAEWMRYLTIAEDIDVEYLGRNGYRILVKLADEKNFCDISDVGVGVSQIFPILVMGLLSKQDSTMIFEQPELHLHPKVQTRLADFFISMSLLNKQCIVESHSEHIINQLRFRIAHDSNSSDVRESTKIYFVEKNENAPKFIPIDINEYGAIPDWPEGFFDQTTKEIIDTIRIEALKKGFREKSN